MKCYICQTQPTLGFTNYQVRAAVGICHNCGMAVCLEHSYKALKPGSPLLCFSCAKRLNAAEIKQPHIAPAL